MTDIFNVEEEIAHAVIGSLKVTLLGNNAGTSTTKPNPEAYNAYLQGRYFFRQSNKAALKSQSITTNRRSNSTRVMRWHG